MANSEFVHELPSPPRCMRARGNCLMDMIISGLVEHHYKAKTIILAVPELFFVFPDNSPVLFDSERPAQSFGRYYK